MAGRRSEPVLVFLHHGLGSVSQWRDFPQRLSQACGVAGLAYDRLGHGRSAGLTGPRTAAYLHDEAALLRDLLQAEGISDCILIGHSDGATIALLYAASPGAHPRGVISEAAHLFVEDATRAGIRAAVDRYRSGLQEKLLPHHGDKTDSLFWNWAGTWLSPQFDRFDIRRPLHEVRCPVLALQGEQDEFGTVAQLEAIAASVSGPVQTVLLAGCGHQPHQEAPETTFRLMQEAIAAWL